MEERSAKKPADEGHHGDSSSRSEDVDSSHARPYDCFFCKRGFSTAQALGGHMNIHRKDRAKQKQQPPATNHATSPLYPNPPNVSFSHSATLKIKGSHSSLTCTNGGESEASRIMRWPWTCYKRDGGPRHEEIDGVRRLRQLPLLVDRSCVGDGHGGERPFRSTTESVTPVAVEEELDLELRLGPTPCGGATGEKRKALHGRQDEG